jgi:hypothetical protein
VDCRAETLVKADLVDLANVNAASYDSASHSAATMKFVYVYILQSELDPRRFYMGVTDDLRTCL